MSGILHTLSPDERGAALPTGIPVLIAIIAALVAMAALLSYAARARFPHCRIGCALGAIAGCWLASGFVYALISASLYQIPAVCSIALAVWGLYLWLRAYCEGRIGCALGGAVCMALIVGCRPPLACVALFGIFP